MEPEDHQPEEREGTGVSGTMMARADDLTSLARTCRQEAHEAEQTSRWLRRRAEMLDEIAMQYREAAHFVENATDVETAPVGLRPPTVSWGVSGDPFPDSPQGGDVYMEQDPVAPDTYRRFEYHSEHGWKRMGPVGARREN